MSRSKWEDMTSDPIGTTKRLVKKVVKRTLAGKAVLTGESIKDSLREQMKSPDPTDFMVGGGIKKSAGMLKGLK